MSFQERLESSAVAKRLRSYVASDEPLSVVIGKVVRPLLEGVDLRPTDLAQLLRKLDIDGPTSDQDLLFSGELRREGGRLHLYHRRDLGSGRLRFTIAHELGHAILARTGPRCPQQGDMVERICDKIAAEILMPAFHLLQSHPGNPTIEMVYDVSRSYQVSRSAAARRMAEVWDVGVLEIEKGKVVWSLGISQRSLVQADEAFRESVARAMKGQPGSGVISFHSGSRWFSKKMEWMCFGKAGQALFLFTPAH
jgi:hypothetical protein